MSPAHTGKTLSEFCGLARCLRFETLAGTLNTIAWHWQDGLIILLTHITGIITSEDFVFVTPGCGSDTFETLSLESISPWRSASWHEYYHWDKRWTGAIFLLKSEVLSTSQVECMAASLCGQEIVYIRAILRDFRWTQDSTRAVWPRVALSWRMKLPRHAFTSQEKQKCTEHISGINLLIKALPVVTLWSSSDR